MHRIYLIHWNAAEAVKRAEILQNAGYNVEYDQITPAILKLLQKNPPDVFVIDLNRLPAQGRDLAIVLRRQSNTLHVPIIFVEGDQEKLVRIKKLLPDASYSNWKMIISSLQEAVTNPPVDPVKPKSVFEAYEDTPLPKKLGIKKDSRILLINAPDNFEHTIGRLSTGIKIHKQTRGKIDLIIWFVLSRTEMEKNIQRVSDRIGQHGLWIAWPKKTSGVKSDLTQTVVRKIGLAAGLVDYKVCSIDATWSGLRFTKRKSKTPVQRD